MISLSNGPSVPDDFVEFIAYCTNCKGNVIKKTAISPCHWRFNLKLVCKVVAFMIRKSISNGTNGHTKCS